MSANVDDLARRFTEGGTFVLDAPDRVPAVWGDGSEVLWARREALILAGPPGVGKTTITGQIVRALVGLQPSVLGYTVRPAAGRVLYLAMDRPAQIRRALRRNFTPDDRATLAERLTVWEGPPPLDLARHTTMLAEMAQAAGASVVIVDSLKDAALGLTEDEVGAGWNRARQTALAHGVDVLELHHTVKRGQNGATPTTLADLYGSAWITAGAGSVVLLWGAAGDLIVDLSHLKQPAEPVGPLRVMHDHAAGTSSVWNPTDPLAVVRAAGARGVTAQDLARVIFDKTSPDANETEKARRKLARLVSSGLAEKVDGAPDPRGGPARTVYRATSGALTGALTHGETAEALTHAPSTHDPDESPGGALTGALTAPTHGSTHARPPSFKEGASAAAPPETPSRTCPECSRPVPAGIVRHPECRDLAPVGGGRR